MRMLLIATASVLSGLVPNTAWAASGDIGCIEAKLGPVAMQRIGDGTVAEVDKGGSGAGALDADRDAFLAARAACRTAGNWSPTAVEVAVSYTQGRAAKLGVAAVFKADKLDGAKLSATYAALPVQDRRSFLEKPSPGAVAAATGAAGQVRARRHVYLYFAALAAIEFYPAEFAAA